MKARAGPDLGVGGPALAAHAFEAGLVDELHVFLAPIVVGGGKQSLSRQGPPRARAAGRTPLRQRHGSPPLRRPACRRRRPARFAEHVVGSDEFAQRSRSNLLKMATTPAGVRHDQGPLDAARSGDEGAFRRIVEDHRAELHAHCYRMLGSLHDADDALQDTLLRAWRALPEFEGRSSLRTWLYRIATNACLDAIARRPKRVLPIDYGPPSAATGDQVSHSSSRSGSSRTRTKRSGSETATPHPRPATSSARPSSSPSSRRCSTYRRHSARC